MRLRSIVRFRFITLSACPVGIAQHAADLPATVTTRMAEENAIVESTDSGEGVPVEDEFVDQRDLAAARYLTACAGCHSLGGPKRSGPDLLHVAG